MERGLFLTADFVCAFHQAQDGLITTESGEPPTMAMTQRYWGRSIAHHGD